MNTKIARVVSFGVALVAIGAGLFITANLGVALVGVGLIVLIDNYLE